MEYYTIMHLLLVMETPTLMLMSKSNFLGAMIDCNGDFILKYKLHKATNMNGLNMRFVTMGTCMNVIGNATNIPVSKHTSWVVEIYYFYLGRCRNFLATHKLFVQFL